MLILNKQIQASYAASRFIKKGIDIFKSTLANFYFVSCWYRYLENDFFIRWFSATFGKRQKDNALPEGKALELFGLLPYYSNQNSSWYGVRRTTFSIASSYRFINL
ncbi:MAG: hypothetical protein RSF00_04840 [Oscillospiraceae bacterium]